MGRGALGANALMVHIREDEGEQHHRDGETAYEQTGPQPQLTSNDDVDSVDWMVDCVCL